MASPSYRVTSVRGFVLLLGSLFLAGCSSFSHDWNKAAKEAAPSDGLQGRWLGMWLSDVNQHTGELRCVVTKEDDGTYRARFHAKYNRVLSFGYTVPLKVEPATNGFKFSGQANLHWYAGGIYAYEGQVDGTNFFSTYSCKYDHGTFKMSRP